MKHILAIPFLALVLIISEGTAQKIQKVDQLLFSEQYNEAIPLLEEMIKKDSSNTMLYFRLGKVYQSLQNNSKAIEYFQKARQLKPESTSVLLNLSNCFYTSGNYPWAEKTLLELNAIDTTNFKAKLLLAKTYATQNKYREGLHIYQQLNQIDSLNPYIYKQMGNLKKRLQDFPGSLASYLKSYELNPNDLSVLLHVIQQFYEMTGYHEALSYANKGLETYPNNHLILKKKAQVLIGLEWYENALNILKDLEERKLLSANGFKQLGICYMQTKQYEQAITSFEKCGQSFEKDPMINFYNGICYSRLHQHEKGIEYLENAISHITPKIKASMHLYLAKSYGNTRQFEKAISEYKKHFEMDDTNPDILYEIATTYEEFGDNKKKALKYYSKYINQAENKEDERYEYAKSRILRIKENIHFEK